MAKSSWQLCLDLWDQIYISQFALVLKVQIRVRSLTPSMKELELLHTGEPTHLTFVNSPDLPLKKKSFSNTCSSFQLCHSILLRTICWANWNHIIENQHCRDSNSWFSVLLLEETSKHRKMFSCTHDFNLFSPWHHNFSDSSYKIYLLFYLLLNELGKKKERFFHLTFKIRNFGPICSWNSLRSSSLEHFYSTLDNKIQLKIHYWALRSL